MTRNGVLILVVLAVSVSAAAVGAGVAVGADARIETRVAASGGGHVTAAAIGGQFARIGTREAGSHELTWKGRDDEPGPGPDPDDGSDPDNESDRDRTRNRVGERYAPVGDPAPPDWGPRPPRRGDDATTRVVAADEEAVPNPGPEGVDKTMDAYYRLNRTPDREGSIRFTYEFHPSADLYEFNVTLESRHTVLSSTGFTDEGGNLWSWDGTTDPATLVVRADANLTSDNFGGYNSVDVGEWAFLDQSVFTERYWYYYYSAGERPVYVRHFSVERRGTVSDGIGFAYLGPYAVHTASGLIDQRYVDPDSATPVAGPAGVMDRIEAYARRFDVKAIDAQVTAFAPGDPIRRGGRAYDDDYWTNANDPLNDTTYGPTWYEEYVHTRQAFANYSGVYGTNMYWLVEATGVYYRNYGAYRFGQLTDGQLRDQLNASQDYGVVLTDVRSSSPGPAYTKGAHVATALDLQIRNVTNGRETLETVLRRVNERELRNADQGQSGTLEFAEFKTLVEDVAGTSLDAWLERYVNSSDIPGLPSDLSAAYRGTPSAPPVAAAGPNRTVDEGTTVELDGRRSWDPNFDALSYAWSQTGGPNATIADGDTGTPAVTLPNVTSDRVVTLSVTATDESGTSATDEVAVTVRNVSAENAAPTAESVSTTTTENASVSATFDASDPDGDALTYAVATGPENGSVTVDGANFTYDPDDGFVGTDSFAYRVEDDAGATDTATVTVTVETAPLSKSWAVPVDGRLQYAQVGVGPERVFVGGLDPTLLGVYRNGTVDWRFERAGSLSDSSPTYHSGTVYVGSGGGVVYAVDADAGTEVWSVTTDSAVVSSPTVAAGTVYVGSNDGTVLAIDADEGTVRWRTDLDAAVVSTPAVDATNDTVYVTTDPGRVVAVDTTGGDPQWNHSTGVELGHASPVVADGDVYVAAADVLELDGTTGDVVWREDYGGPAGSTPTVAGGVLYVGGADGSVSAIDADAGTGQWSFATDSPVAARPVVAGDRVVVPSTGGRVYLLNASTGQEVTNVSLGSPVRAAPALAADRALVGTRAGTVLALANVDGPGGTTTPPIRPGPNHRSRQFRTHRSGRRPGRIVRDDSSTTAAGRGSGVYITPIVALDQSSTEGRRSTDVERDPVERP